MFKVYHYDYDRDAQGNALPGGIKLQPHKSVWVDVQNGSLMFPMSNPNDFRIIAQFHANLAPNTQIFALDTPDTIKPINNLVGGLTSGLTSIDDNVNIFDAPNSANIYYQKNKTEL